MSRTLEQLPAGAFFLPIALAFAFPKDALADGVSYLVVEAAADTLPIAAILGLGALAWLWNHRPQRAPAVARKPPSKKDESRKR